MRASSFNRDLRVGMKIVVKCYKDFFGYFNALKTHGEYLTLHDLAALMDIIFVMFSICLCIISWCSFEMRPFAARQEKKSGEETI